MFWKASSTLLASSADVSINDRLFSPVIVSTDPQLYPWGTIQRTRKLFRLLRGHCAQMSQIALVSDQHDHDVGISMVPQLLQPPVDILVGLMFANVVYEESPDRTTVVSRRDGPVPFLTSSIPNLSLNRLGIHLDRPGSELDSDGGLGVQVELVPGETTQQVGFTNAGVTNQHHYSFDPVSPVEYSRKQSEWSFKEKQSSLLAKGGGGCPKWQPTLKEELHDTN